MLAFLGRNLGIFLSPSILTLPALIRHIEFPFLWLGRRAESQEELITWIAGWMDFWCCLYLSPAGLGGSRPAWPSTIFPTSFDMDFPMHFGVDLASILEPFLMIFPSFGTDIFAFGFSIEFYRISTEFRDPQTMENSIITWDSLKKQKNCIFGFSINFVSDLHTFRHNFGSLFACFLRFSWRRISDVFLGAFFCGFWHQADTQMAPKMDQIS